MLFKKLLAGFFVFSLLVGSVQAGKDPLPPIKVPDSGFYVAGAVGAGLTEDSDSILSLLSGQIYVYKKKNGYALAGVEAGYQFGRNFAMGLTASVMPSHAMVDWGDVRTHGAVSAFTGYMKFMLPLFNRWSLYGKLGAAAFISCQSETSVISVKPRETRTSTHTRTDYFLLSSLGLDYQLTSSIAVGAELSSYGWVFSDRKMTTLTAKLTYSF